MKKCVLIGAPVQAGASQSGCLMGPDALRTAGIERAFQRLGFSVSDVGNIRPKSWESKPHPNKAIHDLDEIAGWTQSLAEAALSHGRDAIPVFLGGDHSLSAGSVSGMAQVAKAEGKPLFILWLDAHSDFHTLNTTDSGNLHGTPVAYFTGQPGFEGYFPDLPEPVPCENVCMMGLRSVDEAEGERLLELGFELHDMRSLDEFGVVSLVRDFLERVEKADGLLHVSLDVDFLDPAIGPGVGTTVPGGATVREAHLIMEMLHESERVRSMDIVELNPFLDNRGQTAKLLVDLAASLFGRKIFDRPTRSFQ